MMPSREWLQSAQERLLTLVQEAENEHGENPAGSYLSEIEMTLTIAFRAVCRELEICDRAKAVVDGVEEHGSR